MCASVCEARSRCKNELKHFSLANYCFILQIFIPVLMFRCHFWRHRLYHVSAAARIPRNIVVAFEHEQSRMFTVSVRMSANVSLSYDFAPFLIAIMFVVCVSSCVDGRCKWMLMCKRSFSFFNSEERRGERSLLKAFVWTSNAYRMRHLSHHRCTLTRPHNKQE